MCRGDVLAPPRALVQASELIKFRACAAGVAVRQRNYCCRAGILPPTWQCQLGFFLPSPKQIGLSKGLELLFALIRRTAESSSSWKPGRPQVRVLPSALIKPPYCRGLSFTFSPAIGGTLRLSDESVTFAHHQGVLTASRGFSESHSITSFAFSLGGNTG
jgi:hypothetical protein